ncbi:MAG TPA: serine protease [Cytophagales bacterium]|nr:serine protease [Cytophagales bacterium]
MNRNTFWGTFFCLFLWAIALQAQERVLCLKIEGEIDPRSTRYVKLALMQAESVKAGVVVAEINTFGGRVDDADKIRTMMLESKVPLLAFINKNAASAGALISIACDSIYMAQGANMGAATVVIEGTSQAAPDKYQSYMRSMMRSTAQANGRNAQIAEAMVDQNLKLDSTIKKDGQVVTFTTQEAIRFGFCDGEANNVKEVLSKSGHENAVIENFELDWAEKVVAYFLNPALSSILIILILGGLYYEVQAPGFGLPIVVSIVAAVLYFIPYYLTGLAQNWEILLFFLGLVLLLLEILVIPGFGIAGILGIVLVLFSLFLVMLNNDFFDFSLVPDSVLLHAGISSAIALVGVTVFVFWALGQLATNKRMAKIALQTKLDSKDGYSAASNLSGLLGKKGKVVSELRPFGKIEIEGQWYSALSSTSFVAKGTLVEVVGQEYNNLKVKSVG